MLPHIRDLRKEESIPSFAGSAARMDFLLKDEKTVLEIKMPHGAQGQKQIKTQLIEDITTYLAHSDYKTFVGFIYDPPKKN